MTVRRDAAKIGWLRGMATSVPEVRRVASDNVSSTRDALTLAKWLRERFDGIARRPMLSHTVDLYATF